MHTVLELELCVKSFLYRIFCGFFLGISIFAPGVSGSVMAVVMGIYPRLIDIVSNPFKEFKKNVAYLFPMGIGALLSLVMFVIVFDFLFETYKTATYLLFMGLIAGNLPVVYKDATRDGVKWYYIIGMLIAIGLAILPGILRTPEQIQNTETVSLLTIGIAGLVGGGAGIIPGMSVSMVLMVPGIYEYMLHAIKTINIPIIATFVISFAVGMVAFSHIIKFVLKRFHGLAYSMVFGFICGSFVSIYMGLPKDDAHFNWLIGAVALIIGLGISLLFVFLSKKFNSNNDSGGSNENMQEITAENSQEN